MVCEIQRRGFGWHRLDTVGKTWLVWDDFGQGRAGWLLLGSWVSLAQAYILGYRLRLCFSFLAVALLGQIIVFTF